MAAVVKWSNWCKLLLAIFLFVSLSFAPGVITTDTSTAITFLDVSASDGVVSAKLTALTVEGGVKHDESILLEAFREAQKGNQVEAETILESAGLGHFEDYLGQVQSETLPIEGAELNFYYLNKVDEDGKFVYVREEVSGCAPLKEEEGSPGVFHCPLPPIYAETCTEVFVTFGDPVYGTQLGDTTYPFIEESVRVCDEETNALAVMRTSITEVLTQGMGNSFCFASILVGGMLIASMFFAGRSPLSLLDITTPLLPKAKSISYGGLRMGTGFGRMMKEMGEMGGAGGGIIASSSKATSARLLRYLRSKKGYNQRLINIIMGSGANELLKMMALRALIAGKNERYLRKILALSGKNVLDPENQKKYGKLISELENLDDAEKLNRYNSIGLKRGESLHEAVIGLSKMSMYNAMQQKAFADSTGEIPAWFKTPLGKTLGRLPFIGTHIMGGTASLFFGGRHLGRFYNNVARGAVRAVGDMATPKGDKKFSERIQMAVNDARRKKQKPGMFAGWVALKDNERQIVKIFDNFEYGSALYKRLMGESKKDILNWLVGTIITHYGGKFALSREEVMRIGLENPEQLMLKKLNSGKFAKMEAELRNILSDTGLDDVQKARRLMKLMNSQGIVFDEMGAKNALNILIGIDRGKPLSTAGEGIVDPENPHAIDSHRLMRLQMYLQEQFKVDQFVDLKTEYMDKGKFFFAVGRTSLASKDADFNFAVFFRKKYREALELPTKAGEKPLTIGDIANYAFLRVVNERWGIMDPNTPGIDAEMKLVMQNAKNWLKSLVNPFASKDTIDSASIASMLSSLTAPSGRDKADEEGGMGLMGFGAEYGPKPGAWRLNMKAHWKLHGGAMGGIKMAAENQADGETNLAHNIPLAVQRAIDKGATYNEAVKKYRRETVESYLFKRLKGIIEQDNPNTYFTSQVEFDRFRQIWASYKAFIAREKLKEGKSGDERDVTDAEVRELIKRKMGVEEVSRGTWIRLREGSFAPFIEK
ncbi:MAG: hypothetical protein GY852_07110, partial [bacterium]|nr:hypothetical protein [bacterium]